MTGEGDEPTRIDAPRARALSQTPPPEDVPDAPPSYPYEDTTVGLVDPAELSDVGDTHRDVDPNAGSEDSISRASLASLASAETRPTGATADEAIQDQDLERTRWFLRVAVVVCVVVAAPTPWLGGDPLVARIFGVAMAVSAASAAVLSWRLRDPAAYTMGRVLGVGFVLVAGAFTGVVYCGMFSPAAAAIPFGLFFFGLSRSARGTAAIYLTCALGYGVLAGLMAFGVVRDPGLVTADHLPLVNRLALLGLTETIFFATFLVARFSFRAAAGALERHTKSLRELAAREALLKEARFDLEGALRARGLGRFTDEVVGSYKLGHILGRGGMGEVYDAVHVDSEEPAAVKLLHPQVLSQPDTVRRFIRECRLASMLEVPNVVSVLEASDPEAAIPYIAMERLRGLDLSDHLRGKGRLGPEEVARLLAEVGAGLDAAHEAGIVHRDMKPRNLFLAQQADGSSIWKILDFGVSKLVSEATMTRQNMVGTPSYMAPEQAKGETVTHRADLFALGIIAYRALTGRPAFSGDGVPQVLYQVIHRMPTRPSLLAQLPSDVDRVLAIALAKDPQDRFESAAELSGAFDDAVRRRLSRQLRQRAADLAVSYPWSRV